MQWMESLVGMILYLFGMPFFVLGMSLISKKPDLKATGVFCIVAGSFSVVAALFAATALGVGTTAAFALTFGVVWLSVGVILIQGYGLEPVGHYSIYAAISMLWYLFAFTSLSKNYILAWSTIMFFITFASIALSTNGKLSLKSLGWVLIIVAILALLVPALMMFMGISFP